MFMIFDLLSLADLHRFRRVSQWANGQVSKTFATRAFKDIRMYDRHDAARRFIEVIQKNKNIAPCVKALTMAHTMSGPWHHLQAGEPFSVSNLTSMLPALIELNIHGFTSWSIARHFLRQYDPSVRQGSLQGQLVATTPYWPQLTTLSIVESEITSREIEILIGLFGAGLANLHLEHVQCTDRVWLGTIREIHRTSSRLASLKLYQLCDPHTISFPDGGACQGCCVTFQRPANYGGYNRKFHKAFRGSKGIEILVLNHERADMHGAQAIDLGLKMITQHLVGQGAR
ncbi:hypothetical protein LTR27_009623 [Elasticomyces elasticus]|nr:hypothetical protein LTR27_009623 [Elasticomyces elasticus]